LYSATGGQGEPSERSGAQALSKLTAIARTTARSLKLITLHLNRPPHGLDAFGIAAGLPGAEEHGGDGSLVGKPSHERERIAKQPMLFWAYRQEVLACIIGAGKAELATGSALTR
jgi:hypothetical protein